MQALVAGLIIRLGFDLALVVLKNLQGVTTLDQAIVALEKTKTVQEYVNEDAARRGITPVPLPTPPV